MGIEVGVPSNSDIDYDWIEEKILLHKLHQEERNLLRETFEIVEYRTGDEIIRQGEPGGWLYLLRSGSAAITMKVPSRTLYLGEAEEAALFGEMTFLSGGDASATVTAHSPCRLYRMDRQGYCRLIVLNQPLLLSLFTYMLDHSARIIRRMNEINAHWP
ncbi:MAG TPA: cyclic nucleotide-binding domain-containing protein [Mariprofundaceae bacterium]|nr:cyclic nucleotide-binding domain-containing protein [Mariprofundaceae bacterium]